ncbi:MAG: MipA/OmpV family protein [Pseudomonadota bacterium]
MIIATLCAAAAVATSAPLEAPQGAPQGAQKGPPAGPPPPPTGWTFGVGVGGFYAPAYRGADEYQVIAAPNFSVAYGTRFSFSPQDGARFVAFRKNGFEAGPMFRANFGRPETGDNPLRIAGAGSDDLEGLGDVDPTGELGGFMRLRKRKFTLSLEARQGLQGHEGFIGEARAQFTPRPMIVNGKPLIFRAGPSLTIVDDQYAQSFFGVTPQQSADWAAARTVDGGPPVQGLRLYEADGGLLSYGFEATAIRPLGRRSSLVMLAGYQRLGDIAADSPIVEDLGSADQLSVGALVSWRFGGGRR